MNPTMLTCERCGAVYEREIHTFPIRNQDSFECSCGHTMERWGSSTFRVFRKVKDAAAKK
jgi:lysyl-tRNA synthetase class I